MTKALKIQKFRVGLVVSLWQVWFGRFGLVGLVWFCLYCSAVDIEDSSVMETGRKTENYKDISVESRSLSSNKVEFSQRRKSEKKNNENHLTQYERICQILKIFYDKNICKY